MSEYRPTPHVIEKMQARNITWTEILDVLDNPEVVYGPDRRGRRNFQKGDLCVVVSHTDGIITVLLKQTEQWTDEDAKSRTLKQDPDKVYCPYPLCQGFHPNVIRDHSVKGWSGLHLFCSLILD